MEYRALSLLLLAVAGCSGRTISRSDGDLRGDSGGPDAPTSSGGSITGSGGATGTGGIFSSDGGWTSAGGAIAAGGAVLPPPDPYAACPDVYTGPVADGQRTDSGVKGLAVLRNRVLESRKAFQKYAAAHGNTYRYSASVDSFTGYACSETVNVTSGSVTEATVSTLDPDTKRWSTTVKANPDRNSNGCVPAIPMDDLYEQCLTKVLCQDPRQSSLYVQIDARGLLVQCGYVPMNCEDDCYTGMGPVLLTADGADWAKPLPGCCAPEAQPDCCMSYGGPMQPDGRCSLACDGMPWSTEPGWHITFDANGCASWREPPEGTSNNCCGCLLPEAGTSSADGG